MTVASTGGTQDVRKAEPDRRRLIFAIVSIGLFMASIDQTNVIVSQTLAAGQGSATGSWAGSSAANADGSPMAAGAAPCVRSVIFSSTST